MKRKMKSSLKYIVSLNIRSFRLEAGLTQQALADKAGFKVSYLARLETDPQNLSLEILERVGNALGKTIAEIVTAGTKITSSRRDADIFLEAMRLLRAFESKI